jgi:hypothetical protein
VGLRSDRAAAKRVAMRRGVRSPGDRGSGCELASGLREPIRDDVHIMIA